MRNILSLLFFFHLPFLFGQRINETIKIDKELSEISGLEQYNDSILVAINDSGNEPLLYFLNFKGQVIKKTKISNAKNNDWEDLTIDDQRNLYIGDFGNNLNQRKDLAVLKLNIDSAFVRDTISVEFIHFSYMEQKAFPPAVGERTFDCESLAWHDGDLLLITKNTDKKANFSSVYHLSTEPGNYVLTERAKRYSSGKLKDQFTAIDYENGILYLLTYKKLSFQEKSVRFKRLTQKEALLVLKNGRAIIAAEHNFILGGPYFHFTTIKTILINESW